MNTKERLYAVIGGCVGAVLTMVVCSVVPIGAQSKADRFGEITCNGIKVVDRNGRTMVELGSGETGGIVGIWSNTPTYPRGVFMEAGEYGGHIKCFPRMEIRDAASVKSVQLGFMNGQTRDGTVEIYGNLLRKHVVIGVNEHGGHLSVYGKGENRGKASVEINEQGGFLGAVGKEMDTGGAIGVNDNGGFVAVQGKGDSEGQALMGVNEYGNGAVSTWDKNGYRLATLK